MNKPVPKLNHLSVKYWKGKWQENKLDWHKTQVRKFLQSYHSQMMEGGTVLVPLCGKTVDMIYLANEGYKVVGIEYSEEAIISFFGENEIDYEIKKDVRNTDFKTYKGLNLNITIHNGNFFDVTPELVGDVDGIWDRGSLIAINPSERSRYSKVMLGLMTSKTFYLLDSLCYDQKRLGGPPFSVARNVVEDLYLEMCDIKLVDEFTSEFCKVRYKLNETLKRKESLYKIVIKTQVL